MKSGRKGLTKLKAMEEVIEGTPQVETYEVSNSTWYKIAAPIAA